jgi:hypothetical protein
MSVLFLFAALFALAAAQCNVGGNTYVNGEHSLTFGAPVDNWVPVIINMGDPSHVIFATFKQATASRWELQAYGAPNGEFCDTKGQYNVQILSGCSELSFSFIEDACIGRGVLLSDNTFTQEDKVEGTDCISSGSSLTSTFQESESSPILSGGDVTWVFGKHEFAIASIEDRAAIFQRWTLTSSGDEWMTEIIDFASAPAGYSCSSTKVGVYNTTYGDECAVRFCGISDGCQARGELIHGAAFNDWTAAEDDEGCAADISVPGFGGESKCSRDEAQWLSHPYDCVDQFDKGTCMFCRGISGGQTVSLCLDRLGAQCEEIFETDARRSYCNLEFECPASTASISLVVFISAFLALFFH